MGGRSLGRGFGWLWTSYALSVFGTRLAFDAFALIAILVLDVGPGAVSALAAVGLAVGAVVAVPIGPWVEFRRKRAVMIAMDLVRFVAVVSVPVAFGFGWLGFGQLLVVSVVVAVADIAFMAASGACLKGLVAPGDLLVANGRLESTNWTATALGPPLGGVAVGLFGPIMVVVVNAVSYLLSAVGIRAIGGGEARPARGAGTRPRLGDLAVGWRHILGHSTLRVLFCNTILVNGLIMASAPLLAVLMLGQLGFTPWQYGLAFGLPCVGGLLGARLAPGLVARFGRHRVMVTAGALRACWPLGLAFVGPGGAGLALVLAVQFCMIACIGVFNPVFATYRLDQIPDDRVVRTLSAWSITSKATIAGLTALWGVLATVTSVRVAVAVAGLLLLATPLLLPRARHESLSGAGLS
ncbi:MFS transporter [Actinokineospora iranica]|uniref:Predicted arabinose efflux permease, MFS family n=1 Tax=Actinokineospora iranica TaxID=1271860 RepID=A0A1G6WMG5_9PSEU|nr:MFS transporter [Actinokineospora iranica]SDD67150.1 Predicted arabinose efflux permease, MFS family [Actinokineospora iranica]